MKRYVSSQLKNVSWISRGSSKTLHMKIVVIMGFEWVERIVRLRADYRAE